jgi:hypothetical protein
VSDDSADGDQQFSVTPSFSQSSSSRDTTIYTRAQVEIAFSAKKLHFFQSFFQGQSALSFIVVLLNKYPKIMHPIFSDFTHWTTVHNPRRSEVWNFTCEIWSHTFHRGIAFGI